VTWYSLGHLTSCVVPRWFVFTLVGDLAINKGVDKLWGALVRLCSHLQVMWYSPGYSINHAVDHEVVFAVVGDMTIEDSVDKVWGRYSLGHSHASS